MFQRLLICTDFSDCLHRLTHFIPSLAAAQVKQIVFLHSVPLAESSGIPRTDTKKADWARGQLNAALQEAPTEVDVQIIVESGSPINAILKAARDYHADLIVMGTSDRNLLTEKLFGNTAVEFCQRTSVPAMILRPQLIATYTAEELDLRCRHLFRYLLIPYSDDASSKYLIERIKPLIKAQPEHSLERIHLCSVVEDVYRQGLPEDYRVAAAQQALEAVKTELQVPNVMIDPIEVRQGDPIVEILEAARMSDISAIALSSDSSNKLLNWSVPNFTNELMRRSWHPIIFFPPER